MVLQEMFVLIVLFEIFLVEFLFVLGEELSDEGFVEGEGLVPGGAAEQFQFFLERRPVRSFLFFFLGLFCAYGRF